MSLHLLRRVAVVGGIVAIGGGSYFTYKIQGNFRAQDYYKESLKIFGGYQSGVQILGEPIKIKKLELGKAGSSYSDGLNAKLTIPLKGTLKSGNLISWSSRKQETDSWRVDKLDLDVDGRQWTFYLNPEAKDIYTPTQDMNTDEELNVVSESSSS